MEANNTDPKGEEFLGDKIFPATMAGGGGGNALFPKSKELTYTST